MALEKPTKGGSYIRNPDGSLHRLTPQEQFERDMRSRKSLSERVNRYLSEDRFSATAVYERMKECSGMNSDADLAWIFGMSPQNMSNRKRRNAVPYREAILIAAMTRTSLNYMLTGEEFIPVESVDDVDSD